MKKSARKSTAKKRRVTRTSASPKVTAPVPIQQTGESFGIRRILVPIDFSIHSKNALRYAVLLAERFGATLNLIYVVEPTIYPADLGFGQVVLPGVEEELRVKGAEELKSLIETEIGGRVSASANVRTGKPHQEILREAEEKGVDLIVVATHGHTGVEHMLFGSTAMRIVRLAKCPVMTVRPKMGEKG